MILFFVPADGHLRIFCGLVDAGFEEIQTFVHFIKAGIHLILEPIQTIISFLLLNLHLLQDC